MYIRFMALGNVFGFIVTYLPPSYPFRPPTHPSIHPYPHASLPSPTLMFLPPFRNLLLHHPTNPPALRRELTPHHALLVERPTHFLRCASQRAVRVKQGADGAGLAEGGGAVAGGFVAG